MVPFLLENNMMNIEELSSKQLERICRDNGYHKTFIRWATFLGYSKDDHAIYKCEFTDTYDTIIGNLYVWVESGVWRVEY